MDLNNLIHMANRIGEFFQAMPDHAEALDGIAQHIQKFWEPRMRRRLDASLDAPEGEALMPIVRGALLTHRPVLGCAYFRWLAGGWIGVRYVGCALRDQREARCTALALLHVPRRLRRLLLYLRKASAVHHARQSGGAQRLWPPPPCRAVKG